MSSDSTQQPQLVEAERNRLQRVTNFFVDPRRISPDVPRLQLTVPEIKKLLKAKKLSVTGKES